eukprot:scaffold3038_cov250-Pinguiococcus_pyrenoidosus.AAC.8
MACLSQRERQRQSGEKASETTATEIYRGMVEGREGRKKGGEGGGWRESSGGEGRHVQSGHKNRNKKKNKRNEAFVAFDLFKLLLLLRRLGQDKAAFLLRLQIEAKDLHEVAQMDARLATRQQLLEENLDVAGSHLDHIHQEALKGLPRHDATLGCVVADEPKVPLSA